MYAGVSYAKLPVGELRWKEPVEPESWDGVRACDTYMPMAMQLDSSAMLVDVDAATSGYPSLKVRDDTTGNQWRVLWLFIILAVFVDILYEKGVKIRETIAYQWLPYRWLVYIGALVCLIVFGVYGIGYNSDSLIYMNF